MEKGGAHSQAEGKHPMLDAKIRANKKNRSHSEVLQKQGLSSGNWFHGGEGLRSQQLTNGGAIWYPAIEGTSSTPELDIKGDGDCLGAV